MSGSGSASVVVVHRRLLFFFFKMPRLLRAQDDAFPEKMSRDDLVDILNNTDAWLKTNWTEQWLLLVDEDPTLRFTHVEYIADISEVQEMDRPCTD